MISTQVKTGIAAAIFALVSAFSYCVIYNDFDPVWLAIYTFWGVLFLLTCIKECKLLKITQIVIFVMIAGVCFKYSYNKMYGMAPMMIAFLSCYRYGFYDKHPRLKLAGSLVGSFIVMLIAVEQIIDVAIWALFMTAFGYFIWLVCDGIKERANNFARSIQEEIKRLMDDIQKNGVDQ